MPIGSAAARLAARFSPRTSLFSPLIILAVVTVAPIGYAGDLAWDGTLVAVFDDTGTGAYTGGTAGVTTFSGTVTFPDVCDTGTTCTVEPFGPTATNYVFSNGSGTVMGLGASSIGIESSVEIIDEEPVTPDTVDLAALFGVTISVGQTLDAWAVDSETAGEGNPGFVDWGVSYVYVTTDPFSNTSYTPTPPPGADFIIWQINEDESDTYSAIGEVDTVPEPDARLAIAIGLLAISSASRHRRYAS